MRIRRSNRATALALIFGFCGFLGAFAPGSAQEWAGRGRLQGTIKDEAGQPVEGARLTFRKGDAGVDPAAPGPASIVTNAKGKWSIGGLGQGVWSVLIEKEGYLQSAGQLPVNEFAVAQPVTITMKKPSKEMLEAAAKAGESGEIRAALEAGNAMVGQERWAEARAEYEKALAKLDDEYKPQVYRAVAQTWAMEKVYDKATENLEAARAIKADDPDTLNLLAQIQYNTNQTDQAIETLKASHELRPEDASTTKLLVDLLVDAGREEEAKPYMAKLPEGTKVDPVSLLNVGIRQYNENQFDKALATFNRVVQENPEMPEAYYYRALAVLPLNKMKEARADFEKFLAMAPNHKNADDAREMLKSM